jgi:hypothetical protein
MKNLKNLLGWPILFLLIYLFVRIAVEFTPDPPVNWGTIIVVTSFLVMAYLSFFSAMNAGVAALKKATWFSALAIGILLFASFNESLRLDWIQSIVVKAGFIFPFALLIMLLGNYLIRLKKEKESPQKKLALHLSKQAAIVVLVVLLVEKILVPNI